MHNLWLLAFSWKERPLLTILKYDDEVYPTTAGTWSSKCFDRFRNDPRLQIEILETLIIDNEPRGATDRFTLLLTGASQLNALHLSMNFASN